MILNCNNPSNLSIVVAQKNAEAFEFHKPVCAIAKNTEQCAIISNPRTGGDEIKHYIEPGDTNFDWKLVRIQMFAWPSRHLDGIRGLGDGYSSGIGEGETVQSRTFQYENVNSQDIP
jgi:hypothetical protein